VFLYVTDSICLITDTARLTITVTPALELEALTAIELCQPENITLSANSFGTATNFIWSTNSVFTDQLNTTTSDSVAEVFTTENGYYYIQISNPGCTLVDSVEVVFTSAALDLSGNQDICVDDETVITASSLDPGITFFNYNWEPDSIIVSGDGTNAVTVSPPSTQYVYLTAESSNGCIITDSILINVSNISSSTVTATASETDVPIGSIVTLTASPSGYTYSWTPAANLTAPNSQVTDALVMQETTYTVTVTDGICTRQAQVTVKAYQFVCEEPFVYVPNAFTPNGDGNNDVLYIRSTIIEEAALRIFNRWGEMVFETNDLSVGWDGTWRGKPVTPDVYDYYLEGYCIDGQDFLIQGNITLIR
jgi:gliding motility-associated-like protein